MERFFHILLVVSPGAFLCFAVFALLYGLNASKWLATALWASGGISLLAAATLIAHRWTVNQALKQFRQALRSLVKGDVFKIAAAFENTVFSPFVEDLQKALSELGKRKREAAERGDNIWNARRLYHEVQRLFGDSSLAVIANREPYIHNKIKNKIQVLSPASGLVSALEPIMRACSGVWIGHGSGNADRQTSNANGIILVPPNQPEYALKRVWLSKEEENGYYYGFANEGLWPLCHIAHTRPVFRTEDWEHYVKVNGKFAKAFAEEMKSPHPIALVQDYHFALLPSMIKKLRPDAITSLFWHIPWPNPEAILICPWKKELLLGMLAADLIGFHTQYHCNNFLDTVDRFLEARVDRENFSVNIHGQTCFVKPFPISIEWPPRHDIAPEQIPAVRAQVIRELKLPYDAIIGVGIDRLDYTKGITERLLAVERLLELHPEWIGRFVFLQISAPSRIQLKRYQELDAETRSVAERINLRFHRRGYQPVISRIAHHEAAEVFRFYRAADVCVVSSLHDGMNLVAKEYIAAHSDNRGALVLSAFTGAARELMDALIVNPYDTDEMAQAIHKAITMETAEVTLRMSRMRNWIADHNIYAWAGSLLSEIAKISDRREIPQGEINRESA